MSSHVTATTSTDLKCELIQPFRSQSPVLKLDNSYVLLCNAL